MHIDSSFMPLAPGKVLVNPDYVDIERLPAVLKSWDVLVAPRPDPAEGVMAKISMCSPWTSINVLSITEKKVVVERTQPTLIKALKDWGFEPIPCDFLSYGPFGGAFHCATLDVRRRGGLQSFSDRDAFSTPDPTPLSRQQDQRHRDGLDVGDRRALARRGRGRECLASTNNLCMH